MITILQYKGTIYNQQASKLYLDYELWILSLRGKLINVLNCWLLLHVICQFSHIFTLRPSHLFWFSEILVDLVYLLIFHTFLVQDFKGLSYETVNIFLLCITLLTHCTVKPHNSAAHSLDHRKDIQYQWCNSDYAAVYRLRHSRQGPTLVDSTVQLTPH